MALKTYRGIREASCFVVVLDGAAGASPPPSPSGPTPPYELVVPRELLTKPASPFDWGCGAENAGTHYLAIALLADLLGSTDRVAIKTLLPPMRRFLARLPQEGFEISDTVFHALLYAVGGATASLAEFQSPSAQPGTQTAASRDGADVKPPPLPGTDSENRGERHAV